MKKLLFLPFILVGSTLAGFVAIDSAKTQRTTPVAPVRRRPLARGRL
jgi:hypothetical protein